MKNRVLVMAAMGTFLFAAQALAQQKTVTGRVMNEQGGPQPGVQIVVRGTRTGTVSNSEGNYSIRAEVGQVLQFRLIGSAPEERTVGAEDVINVQLRRVPTTLNTVVVTALGQTAEQRSLGTAQQTVSATQIAQTQRENFVNALQGRVAGVNVTSTSGVPGASASITIRGVSSISSSNQPLFIVDGLPMDNKTLNSNVLASDAPGSATAFNNRGVDFTNRAADVNPEDIESITVLKGAEASALYGIDAANGAVVIKTKRGRAGAGSFEYSNSFRFENTRSRPDIQRTYAPSGVVSGTASTTGTSGSFVYFGPAYPDTTTFYDNVDGFFRTGVTQKHNLAFSGGAGDGRVNYRFSSGLTRQEGVIRNSDYNRLNLTGASQAQVKSWLNVDLSMAYTYATNNQPFKGEAGPLIGLLVWPQHDNARDYLTAAGTRRRLLAGYNIGAQTEVDNPYFSVNKNRISSRNNRLLANVGFTLTPFAWGSLKTNIGADTYTNQNSLLRHPESSLGFTYTGILDQADDITRNINVQSLLNVNSIQLTPDLTIKGLVGTAVSDARSQVDALVGQSFLDPSFVSVNNTSNRSSRTTLAQRRLLSAFGQATLDYKRYLYLTLTGRNDWTSTIPRERNSFFYPSVSTSFVFSDAFPSVGRFMTGKLRAAYAEVGKDARPYAYRPSLEFKPTTGGGYGYGFTGPNLELKPEFARSYEVGTEMSWFNDRLGLDATVYRKQTKDQIVNDIRGSYATGFILFNLNGAVTRNQGVELTLRGTPVQRERFTWDVLANFDRYRGKVLSLPSALPESYVSDTWLYSNVRNGTAPGLSTESLTGLFYLRNKDGKLLIDPSTGLPLRSTTFVDAGYDRTPDFTVGLSNTLRYKRLSLDFLLDIRKGGDVFNATEHYLTARGLSPRTLDRNEPRVIEGVLRDGRQNSDNPTVNNIVITPGLQTDYFLRMSEELFIEKDINWLRLRDVTLAYGLPERFARNASVYVTATDLFILTNYTGLDPVVNGNSAAVGGSGAAGIDYGNFPIPRGFNFGLKLGF